MLKHRATKISVLMALGAAVWPAQQLNEAPEEAEGIMAKVVANFEKAAEARKQYVYQ